MIKTILRRLLDKTALTSEFYAVHKLLKSDSYLRRRGWLASCRASLPCDEHGQALPWLTYGAIYFLEQRIAKTMTIFEYGSGNSTVWWSKRVARVISCEHNAKWYETLKDRLPKNVEYIRADLEQEGGAYSKEIAKYSNCFDIVVLDGRNRVDCAKNSLQALRADGIIVWDNSERVDYVQGFSYLAENGFKRLDFDGFGPINAYGWRTSIFYRRNNCVDL